MQPANTGSEAGTRRPLRIAMVAPPWISIPAPTYGGIEEVVRLLCQGLVARGNHVTLYAAPDSESDARVVEVLDESHPDQIEDSLIEAAHVGSVFGRVDRERVHAAGFDVVHDHCPAVALAMADRLREPFVHTLHGPFDDERIELYRRQGHKATLVAISESQRSQAPEGVECRHVVPNPIDLDEWPFRDEKDDGLLFLGRLDPDKGPHRAIEAAHRAGRRLALAGPVQPEGEEFFASEVEPRIDDDHVRYLGPLGPDDKREALTRGRPVDADRMGGAVWTGDDRGARNRDAGDRLRSRCRGGDRDRRRERIPRIGRRRHGGGDRSPARDRSASLPQVGAALRRRHGLRRLRGRLRRRHLAHRLGVQRRSSLRLPSPTTRTGSTGRTYQRWS